MIYLYIIIYTCSDPEVKALCDHTDSYERQSGRNSVSVEYKSVKSGFPSYPDLR